MRQIRELLRLEHACRMSDRLIGEALGMGRTTVGGYLRRLAPAGIGWPVPDAFDDAALEARLFVKSVAKRGCREPDCAASRRRCGCRRGGHPQKKAPPRAGFSRLSRRSSPGQKLRT